MKPKLIILTLSLILFTAICHAQAAAVKVVATGQAAADLANPRQEAIDDALRQAVEAGAGVKLASETEVHNFQLIRDNIYTQTAGLVESYNVLQENPNQDGFYTVRIEAIISRADINVKMEAWKALLQRKGYPKVMIVGSVDKRPFDYRLTAELQDMLEQRKMTVIDLDMLNENQRLDAERAAKGDLDPAKAALVVREVGADYFVVVSIEGSQSGPHTLHGIQMYKVDATAILKVIAVDKSQVIASKVVNLATYAQTVQQAANQSSSKAAENAMVLAFRRIGENWLNDVDQRGGAQIQVLLNQFPFERMQGILTALQQHGGLEVVVDSTDDLGRTQWRIITNSSAVNVASVLKQIDPGIRIAKSSKYRIEIEPGTATDNDSGDPKKIVIISAGAAGACLVVLALIKLLKK